MEDAVRLSEEKFNATYEEGFRTWYKLCRHAVDSPGLPSSYLSIEGAFRQQPSFPRNLRLQHVKYASHSRAYATGSSLWGSPEANCEHRPLPSFQQRLQVQVAISDPVTLSIAETSDNDSCYTSWFAGGNQNCLTILMLAWAYILSARWTELMPEPCSLQYTSARTAFCDEGTAATTGQQADQEAVRVDIGDASPEEVRWWAAVLAPGQGWRASMILGRDTFLSPWSVYVRSGPRFAISQKAMSPLVQHGSHPAPSFSDARRFLDRFCVRHGVTDQSNAALAAVLLFPPMAGHQPLQLPAPRINSSEMSTESTPPLLMASERLFSGCQADHLDRLLTLGCHIRGIRAMLLSAFYEPAIECNAVTPWLQGTLAAIDSLVGCDTPHILGRMFMDRQPKVAFLWLGATILGLQQNLLQDVRFGQIQVELHSAAWSETIQSFMQQPVSVPLVTGGYVARADECRLLYLSQSESHNRFPVCQWKPFGTTLLEDTDVEVRIHAECKGHGLQYQGFLWDCVDGQVASQLVDGVSPCVSRDRLPAQPSQEMEQVPIFYGLLNRAKEFVSENETRKIFGWLRVNGYASHEREIRRHEWFEILDSDDSDEDHSESGSHNGLESSLRVSSCISAPESSPGA